ncbi:BTB/POZ domain-containing protein [Vigna angularis]|uniref:BTB/POZ domain-containing protein n=1 Tax=Phaseolus angularis TaxID=3914 RepID=A0A8T0KT44_PHAAN|nr:BTB/POZ domain-containing protein [Vigna angularis]
MSEEHKFSNDKRCKVQDRLSKLLWELALLDGGNIWLTMVGWDDLMVSMEVEINDCDNVEMYVEVVVLIHYEDLKVRLHSMGDGVSKVLSLLSF